MNNMFNGKDKEDVKELGNDKLPLEAIDPKALIILGKVAKVGLDKYGKENHGSYRNGNIDDYFGAMLRHYVAHVDGNEINDTGLPHLYHMAWNAVTAAIIYMIQHEADLVSIDVSTQQDCTVEIRLDGYADLVNEIAEKVRQGETISAKETSILLFDGGWDNRGSRE